MEWDEPEFPNGIIKYYVVNVFEICSASYMDPHNIESNSTELVKKEPTCQWKQYYAPATKYRLKELKSFTDYKIMLWACTTDCNENETSNSLTLKTAIGGKWLEKLNKIRNFNSRLLFSSK